MNGTLVCIRLCYTRIQYSNVFCISIPVIVQSECVYYRHAAGRANHLGGFELRHQNPLEDAFVAAREKPRWSDISTASSRSPSPASTQQPRPTSPASARVRSTSPSAASTVSSTISVTGVARAASPTAARQFEPYTTFVPGFYGEIDHVFYDPKNLRCDRWIPTPPHETVLEYVALPNVLFPSDHLALVCELSYK